MQLQKLHVKSQFSAIHGSSVMGKWYTIHAYMHAWLFRFVVAPDFVLVSEPMIINWPGRFVHFCFERISNTCGESRKVMKHITSRVWTWTYTQQQKKITSNIKFLYFLCNVYAFRFISWEWFIITLSHFLMVVLLSLACLTNQVIIKLMTKILDKFYNNAFCINFRFFFLKKKIFRLRDFQSVKIAT